MGMVVFNFNYQDRTQSNVCLIRSCFLRYFIFSGKWQHNLRIILKATGPPSNLPGYQSKPTPSLFGKPSLPQATIHSDRLHTTQVLVFFDVSFVHRLYPDHPKQYSCVRKRPSKSVLLLIQFLSMVAKAQVPRFSQLLFSAASFSLFPLFF